LVTLKWHMRTLSYVHTSFSHKKGFTWSELRNILVRLGCFLHDCVDETQTTIYNLIHNPICFCMSCLLLPSQRAWQFEYRLWHIAGKYLLSTWLTFVKQQRSCNGVTHDCYNLCLSSQPLIVLAKLMLTNHCYYKALRIKLMKNHLSSWLPKYITNWFISIHLAFGINIGMFLYIGMSCEQTNNKTPPDMIIIICKQPVLCVLFYTTE